MADVDIERLSIFATTLGADGPFQRILACSQEKGMEESEGFFFFPILQDLLEEFVPEAIDPDIEMTLTMFTESAPFHKHEGSDGVLFIKPVDGQDLAGWRWGINHRWHPMACFANRVINIPRNLVHGLRRHDASVLYAITANYPPLDERDIVPVKDMCEQ